MENRVAADGFLLGQAGAVLLRDQSGRRRVRPEAEKILEPLRGAGRRHSVARGTRTVKDGNGGTQALWRAHEPSCA